MWIFTPTAFVSIVAHRTKPGILLVRARLRGDIERLFPGAKVKRTPTADYRFRAEIQRERVAKVVADQLRELAYDNVKAAIPTTAPVHDLRHRAMNQVWGVMNRAQVQGAHPNDPQALHFGPRPAVEMAIADLEAAPGRYREDFDLDRDRLPWD